MKRWRWPFLIPVLLGNTGPAVFAQNAPVYPIIRPSGRFQFDGAKYFPDNKHLVSGTQFRRLRLALGGDFADNLHFMVEIDAANDQIQVRDAWLTYDLNERWRLQAGQFKEPFTLEGTTSANYIAFMERSLIDGFVAPRHLGVALRGALGHGTLQGGVFGQTSGSVGNPDFDNSEAIGLTARGTYAPILQERQVLHVGAGARWRKPDAQFGSERNVRFAAFDETHVDRTRFYDTGDIPLTDWYTQFVLEGALIMGPVFAQAEVLTTRLQRAAINDPVFNGAYLFLSFIPTGESRLYESQNGTIGWITPARHAWGALELLVRLSAIDLNHSGITGGGGHNWTLGANWYAHRFVRLMLNYVITNHDDLATGDGRYLAPDNFRVLQARLQYFFR